MSDLIDTTEMYLRTVYELLEEGVAPLRARIAERLHQSGPTVSQTVARMERDGLLVVQSDRTIKLTKEGSARARSVMRKHRLVERLLTDVIGLELQKVHDEACRWEHVISLDVEQHLVNIINDPVRSPFGNPIPALDELDVTVSDAPEGDVLTLAEAVRQGATRLSVVRLSEHLQASRESFAVLLDAGVLPGAVLERVDDGLGVRVGEEELEISPVDAELLFVTVL
ncbi:metal-dependent transcriptional regulator [uncultured Tessaracoccus sp.]|uniref:metal-dependent transcriptional regulator n=1 Tax=uncultured Tessaracoccus sp. TaxID=905023 RepID=UPI00260A288F|nr:metal-dependent transcriptional regulator [uncultured Tessaracoccus sp.]